ncbi:hypothetical protein WICPIJ_008422 [Wickerhamomyces pijperi]|uniref:Protein kinase domain-containing protein n=1 Tax=Wickerhamomyces pijperi TaxID=599730 RepID=A0A9P8TIG8_WICPI|nr:hypothetical protein WICPIJ_008422 [Wickerhamomyces pijperi]
MFSLFVKSHSAPMLRTIKAVSSSSSLLQYQSLSRSIHQNSAINSLVRSHITSKRFISCSRSTLLKQQWGKLQTRRPPYIAATAVVFSVLTVSLYVNNQFQAHLIFNEANDRDSSHAESLTTLKPDPKQGDTYESSLYHASQDELSNEEKLQREEKLNSRFAILYKIQFFWHDYIWDPSLTILRFLKLTLIFTPALFTYFPLTFFSHSSRSYGNLIWFKILRLSLEAAGASFIKLGQWAASRTDLFSAELCCELSQLHSNAKAHSLKYTKEILIESFGGLKFEEIFDEFQETPIGVGAIAQVYSAKLSQRVLEQIDDFANVKILKKKKHWFFHRIHNDEEKPDVQQTVAIKVMHPNVITNIRRDLQIMSFFARAIDCLPTMEWVALPDEVANFGTLMNLQLDLRIEGLNLSKFQKDYKDDFFVNFPTPYLKFSNRFILVEEYISGLPMSKLLSLKSEGLLPQQVSKKLSDTVMDSFLQMLILNNFIHSDLHPGNIIVRFIKTNDLQTEILSTSTQTQHISHLLNSCRTKEELSRALCKLDKEGYHPEVCYIDAGLVTELNTRNRVNFISLFNALAQFDGYKAGELMIERSRAPETAIDPELFAIKVEKLVSKIKERTFTLGTVSIGDLLEKMLSMVRAHHVKMEGDFVSVIVAILLLEGLGRQLDPELDLFARFLSRQDDKGFGKLIDNADKFTMLKVWIALELRQFITVGVADIYRIVKSDQLCPNY